MKKEEVNGATLVTKTVDETRGKVEAELLTVEASNQSSMKIAVKMAEIAELKSQTIEIKSNGESQIAKVMEARRKYEHLNAKVETIAAFKSNSNLKIFGDNSDDVLSQMAAYRITNDKKAL